jgi:acetolactate synthase-1/2/3 large subunit
VDRGGTPEDEASAAPSATARRRFLTGLSLAGAAVMAPAGSLRAQGLEPAPTPAAGAASAAPPPDLPTETLPPPADPITQTSSGGDFMVDVFKTLELEYLAMNPASNFRGLHEAVLNHGMNSQPEVLTCTHEEIAIAMAHGYAKIEGRPMAVACHGTVGLQHGAMALYNAWCDRVPIYAVIGNIVDADKRLQYYEWTHSAIDPAALVRDFIKWDDQPASLQHFAESAVRAYRIAVTPPMGPVLLSLDAELQENPIPEREPASIPPRGRVIPPVGDPAALAQAAQLLVAAEHPLLLCDRMVRTPAGLTHLVELAQLLQCAVVDLGGRMNFPSRHPLNQSWRRPSVVAQADVILGIEVNDLYVAINALSDRIARSTRPLYRPGTKIITLGSRELYLKSNYQDFGRFNAVELAIDGDGEASLPGLIEQVRRLVDAGRRRAFDARGRQLAQAHQDLFDQSRSNATIGWDAQPITTARLCAEIHAQIRNEDWSLVGNGIGITWPQQLWDFDRTYRWIGSSGGAGIGYNAPASLGAALANRRHGRLSVSIQGDGDLLYVPSTLWTAAHHRIPILYVMHNNRAYHQEYMYLQAMANRHMRGITNAHIGTTLTDPAIDFATVARGFGVYAEGPITDPRELGPALQRAVAVVRRGEPALVDVVTDPR